VVLFLSRLKFALVAKIIAKAPKLAKVLKIEKAINPCNCFTAGTKVQTDEGEKPIEDIKVGDKVLAKDDETGEMAYKEVEWLFHVMLRKRIMLLLAAKS
jgi:hypothetical protein